MRIFRTMLFTGFGAAGLAAAYYATRPKKAVPGPADDVGDDQSLAGDRAENASSPPPDRAGTVEPLFSPAELQGSADDLGDSMLRNRGMSERDFG
jgi:hypothetical protein